MRPFGLKGCDYFYRGHLYNTTNSIMQPSTTGHIVQHHTSWLWVQYFLLVPATFKSSCTSEALLLVFWRKTWASLLLKLTTSPSSLYVSSKQLWLWHCLYQQLWCVSILLILFEQQSVHFCHPMCTSHLSRWECSSGLHKPNHSLHHSRTDASKHHKSQSYYLSYIWSRSVQQYSAPGFLMGTQLNQVLT